jgi:3-hydroxyacyl-[acyl-carrier-protein] dehydratase
MNDAATAPCHVPVRFAADHPSFAGHFPGRPIVAGVLLLERVADALRQWRGASVRQVVDAKFLQPLLPEEDALIELADSGNGRYRFVITRGGDVILRGTLEGSA